MGQLVTLSPDVWTEVKPAGFGGSIFQVQGTQGIHMDCGASEPSGSEYGSRHLPSEKLIEVGTQEATWKLWMRPTSAGQKAFVAFVGE